MNTQVLKISFCLFFEAIRKIQRKILSQLEFGQLGN